MQLPADKRPVALWLLAATIAALTWLLVPPVPQPPQYHDFADWHVSFGIHYSYDTFSNILFILSGLAGLRYLHAANFIDPREVFPYRLFFVAVILTGLGSGYYHLAPDNGRLLWDRAGISLAMASWFAAILCERVNVSAGLRLLPILYFAALGSVVYWGWSEMNGNGDLRAYGLVQLYPMLLIPLLLWLYPARYSGDRHILMVIVLYVLALVCDLMDHTIASATGIVSGHTMKHVIASLAIFWVLLGLRLRKLL